MRMIIMKRITIKIALLSLLVGQVYSQIDNTQVITKTGTTSASFLKITPDARSAALGNAFVAVGGDIANIFWNPAGLDHLQRSEVKFISNKWLAGVDYVFFGYALKLPNIGTLALSVSGLSVPDDIVRTEYQPNGTGEKWNAQDMALTASISRRLTDHFSIGGNVKAISQRIWHSKSTGIALDFGALYLLPFWDVRLGAMLSNYGSAMSLSGRDLYFSDDPNPNTSGTIAYVNSEYQTDRYPLPMIFRVGLAGEIINNSVLRWSWMADAQHPNDNLESVNLGSEIGFKETLFLRCGYSNLFLAESESGLNLGLGVNYRIAGSGSILKFDYSYSDYGILESAQRFSLGLAF